MRLLIHDKSVICEDLEYGIYKSNLGGLTMDYATLDINHFARVLNTLEKSMATKAVSDLRDLSIEQSKWANVPRVLGFPLLRGPEPTPISDVRENISNTKRLMDKILGVLS